MHGIPLEMERLEVVRGPLVGGGWGEGGGEVVEGGG